MKPLLVQAILASMVVFGSITFVQADVIGKGKFAGASGHVTKGNVTVTKNGSNVKITFGSKFFFDGAPDPTIGFGKNGKFIKSSQISKLKANRGQQSYSLPTSKFSGYDAVYIWCKKYAVPLGKANIN